LRSKQGKESLEIDEELSSQEASTIIKELMESSQKNGQTKPAKINEPRLGMAMKECYRYFRHYEKDILKEHRQRFKENVIKTYQLFTEIAQELEQNSITSEMSGG
jgi:polyhydroxyalkanoate synthesis regulator phasin